MLNFGAQAFGSLCICQGVLFRLPCRAGMQRPQAVLCYEVHGFGRVWVLLHYVVKILLHAHTCFKPPAGMQNIPNFVILKKPSASDLSLLVDRTPLKEQLRLCAPLLGNVLQGARQNIARKRAWHL